MLPWVSRVLLGLLLPTLLAPRGEGKETVGQHAAPGRQRTEEGQGTLSASKS